MRDVVRSVLDFNFSLTERSVKETEKDDMPDHGPTPSKWGLTRKFANT